MIDIKGIDKAKLLAALVNQGSPLGMGILSAGHLTEQRAAQMLAECNYIDYAMGVPIKADFSGDTFDPWGYDRDHGAGRAARVVKSLIGGAA